MEDLKKARIEHNSNRCTKVYLTPQGLRHEIIRHLALRPGLGHRILRPGLDSLRNGAASSSLPTRDSPGGVNSWAIPSLPPLSWTGSSTIATCSTSAARATGSGKNGRPVSSTYTNYWPPRPRPPATNHTRPRWVNSEPASTSARPVRHDLAKARPLAGRSNQAPKLRRYGWARRNNIVQARSTVLAHGGYLHDETVLILIPEFWILCECTGTSGQ